MKVKAGQAFLTVPEFYRVFTVSYSPGRRSRNRFAMQPFPRDLLEKLRKEQPHLRGVPTHYSIDSHNNRIEIFPTPGIQCEIRVRYTPAIKEV